MIISFKDKDTISLAELHLWKIIFLLQQLVRC